LVGSMSVWLPILEREFRAFPDAVVISLGEPLLSVLVHPLAKVRAYWGYNPKTRISEHPMTAIEPEASAVKRRIFPFPHVPSRNKHFYSENLKRYIKFVQTSGAS